MATIEPRSIAADEMARNRSMTLARLKANAGKVKHLAVLWEELAKTPETPPNGKRVPMMGHTLRAFSQPARLCTLEPVPADDLEPAHASATEPLEPDSGGPKPGAPLLADRKTAKTPAEVGVALKSSADSPRCSTAASCGDETETQELLPKLANAAGLRELPQILLETPRRGRASDAADMDPAILSAKNEAARQALEQRRRLATRSPGAIVSRKALAIIAAAEAQKVQSARRSLGGNRKSPTNNGGS